MHKPPVLLRLAFSGILAFIGLAFSQAATFNQSHPLLDKTLKTYVKDGLVDYSGLTANRQDLDRYLGEVAAVPEPDFETWTERQRLAFLINAYNAYTLQLIIDHYPVKSIKDIGNFWRGPWDHPVVHLFGRTRTLNDLEQKILRVQYHEPRIHFALVCAAHGCPPLRSGAYGADFAKQSGSVLAFLKPYWPAKEAAVLAPGDFRIRSTDYDWSLNERKPQ